MSYSVLIVIPCYNEAETIASTLFELKEVLNNTSELKYEILVVNDCSTDNSLDIIKQAKVNYIDLPINLGIGGTVQTGYLYAQKNNFDIAVQFDGDGQHDPVYISKIVQPIIERKANVVIGSRFLNKEGFQSSFLRRLGIRYFSLLNNILVKTKILDTTSGFRALDSKAIEEVCKYYPENYPEPEVIVLFVNNKFKLLEVPVLMRARTGGVSSISGLKALFYMFKVSIGSLFLYIRLKIGQKNDNSF
ncbi:glycosyltransferase family 2 protein [Pseudofulvibacter geojedonensis]|uniref:Glycosyltransferase family 2 protein n=1 Tax=Pseudofulvibacter geojedonensis TaxID=1123758 RepID=A0ABW3I6P5_9FLAO